MIDFSQILEKITKERLVTLLEENILFSKNQYGFRPSLGTEDALYSITQSIHSELDDGQNVITIFFNLATASDTVNHKIL